MEIKLVNIKFGDSIIVSGESFQELRETAAKEMEKRGWKEEDCHSEEV